MITISWFSTSCAFKKTSNYPANGLGYLGLPGVVKMLLVIQNDSVFICCCTSEVQIGTPNAFLLIPYMVEIIIK